MCAEFLSAKKSILLDEFARESLFRCVVECGYQKFDACRRSQSTRVIGRNVLSHAFSTHFPPFSRLTDRKNYKAMFVNTLTDQLKAASSPLIYTVVISI